MLGVTVPTGALIRMVSLIFRPITIRFKVLLLLVFLGRVFGKLRFLKGWLFFMWTAAHGQILTLDNLMLRGRPLVNRCYLCCCNTKSVDHLLLFCR